MVKASDMNDKYTNPELWTPPPQESGRQRFTRKFVENPLIPFGMTCTVGALVYGFYNFMTGNSKMQQSMMRTRVVAQGATVAFIIAGIAFNSTPKQKDDS